MRRLFSFAALITAVALVCDSTPTSAHELPISEMRIVAAKDVMHMEVVLNAAALNFFAEIDRNNNGFLDPGEIEQHSDQISKLIVDSFAFQIDGKIVPAATAGIVPNVGSHHLTVRAHYVVDARKSPVHMESLLVAITRNSHILEVTFQRADQTISVRLDAHDQGVLFDYEKEKEKGKGKALPVQPTSLPDSDKSLRDYRLHIGLAALLRSLILFRGNYP
ncbi:MAG: hypothetical protein ABGX16_14415 [Pirellulales bacterium]